MLARNVPRMSKASSSGRYARSTKGALALDLDKPIEDMTDEEKKNELLFIVDTIASSTSRMEMRALKQRAFELIDSRKKFVQQDEKPD